MALRLKSWVLLFVFSALLCASCEEQNSPPSDLSDRYNQLAKELLALRSSAAALYKNSREENHALGRFNMALEDYLVSRTHKFESAEEITAAFPTIAKKYNALMVAVGEMEVIAVHTLSSLNDVGDKVLKPDEQSIGRSYVAMITLRYSIRGKQLDGIRSLVERDFQDFCDYHREKFKVLLKTDPLRKIMLQQHELGASVLHDGQSLVRTAELDALFIHSQKEIEEFAQTRDYDTRGASHYYAICARTGGYTTFGESPENLSTTLVDILSNIKAQMNRNQDGVDLVILFERSEKMIPVMEHLAQNMVHVTLSLQAIKATGRRVRMGLVTFSNPGEEVIEAPTSEESGTWSAALLKAQLRKPLPSQLGGGGVYHGLNKILETIEFKSETNRYVIIITDKFPPAADDPKYAEFVQQVQKDLGTEGKRLTLYTILTR